MPSSSPRVPFDEDILRSSAGTTNGIDGSLVELADEGVVLVVELVVGVEDDLLVGRVSLSYGRPPRAEAGHVRDDIVVVSPEVVRVYDGVGAPGGVVSMEKKIGGGTGVKGVEGLD